MTPPKTDPTRRFPAGKFVAITAGISFVVLTLGWSSWAQQCPSFATGISSPGQNPCALAKGMCYATGPGYTCLALGQTVPELCYKITAIVSPWNRCSNYAPGGPCVETMSSTPCGTTQHYPQVTPGSTCKTAGGGGCGTPCVGNWD
jgi:hypothetical protein